MNITKLPTLKVKKKRSLLGWWNHGKTNRPWSILFTIIIVVISTTTLIIKLNRSAERSDLAEHLLLYTDRELKQISALEWQAIAEKKLDTELIEEIQEARSKTIKLIKELQVIEPDQQKLSKLISIYYKYIKYINQELQLIAVGQIDQAIIFDRDQVDPTYELLSDEMANLSVNYTHQKQQASQIAEKGSALAFLLSAGIIGILFWQFNQARQTVQLAIAEQRALNQSEERFRSLVQNASDIIILLNAEAVITYVTISVLRVLGCSPEELIGTKISHWVHPDDTNQIQNFLNECLANPKLNSLVEVCFRHSDKQWCYVEIVGNNLLDHPSLEGIVLTIRDITDRKQAIERLRHHAFHDSLTGLPNRALFMDRLKNAVKCAQTYEDYVFGVLFLDLDRFKIVNDSLGHKSGDQLLIAIASRLKVCLRNEDTISRLGGDEFAILLNDIKQASYASDIAERIQKELALPFNLHGYEVFTSVSIGIVIGSKATGWLDDILRNADIAMYHAKALGKAGYKVFDTAMHQQAVIRLQLETDLRRAIERQEFELYYQAIVSLATGKVTGFEALIRWNHPEHGFISPIDFIPLAEETGLIIPIGEWILEQACCQTSAWQKQFSLNSALTISINVSVKQFKQSNIIKQINQTLEQTKLNPSSVRLEITESLLLENTEFVNATLSQLKALGVVLSLDDFGTGYSSLSHLNHFPIDILKIDRSFTNKMTTNDKSLEIVRASITMANALGMEVVAEGIETTQQLDQLQKLQCHYGQGYLFSKPIDALAATELITQNLIKCD